MKKNEENYEKNKNSSKINLKQIFLIILLTIFMSGAGYVLLTAEEDEIWNIFF